jgi:hypothetical protein
MYPFVSSGIRLMLVCLQEFQSSHEDALLDHQRKIDELTALHASKMSQITRDHYLRIKEMQSSVTDAAAQQVNSSSQSDMHASAAGSNGMKSLRGGDEAGVSSGAPRDVCLEDLQMAFSAVQAEKVGLESRLLELQTSVFEQKLAMGELSQTHAAQVEVLESQAAARREQHIKLAAANEQAILQLKSYQNELADTKRKHQLALEVSQASLQRVVASQDRAIKEVKSELAIIEAEKASSDSRCRDLTSSLNELRQRSKAASDEMTHRHSLQLMQMDARLVAVVEKHALFQAAATERESALQEHVARYNVALATATSRSSVFETVLSAAGDAVQELVVFCRASRLEAQQSLSEAIQLVLVMDEQRRELESMMQAFQVLNGLRRCIYFSMECKRSREC